MKFPTFLNVETADIPNNFSYIDETSESNAIVQSRGFIHEKVFENFEL